MLTGWCDAFTPPPPPPPPSGLPTLLRVAMGPSLGRECWQKLVPAGEPRFLPDTGDGVDVWDMLSVPGEASQRTELLHECHSQPAHGGAPTLKGLGNALTVGDFKIIMHVLNLKSTVVEEGWFPPPGQVQPLLTSLLTTVCRIPRLDPHVAPSPSVMALSFWPPSLKRADFMTSVPMSYHARISSLGPQDRPVRACLRVRAAATDQFDRLHHRVLPLQRHVSFPLCSLFCFWFS